MATADPNLFAKLHNFVVINPSLAGLAERLQLKRLVPVAVDRAIVEIMPPVVERSVTIACMTAYEMVTKDYAVDPDENRLRSAAHLMVSSLAGSLALVTCKEPLRVSLANQLHALLSGQMEAHVLEGALQVLVNDNLELGCSIIERAATDKAVRDIDKSLAAAYEARGNARARGQPFYERALYAQSQQGRFPAALPESLKPKPGLPQQQRVYEDFARMPRALPPHPLNASFRPDGAPPASPLQQPQDGSAVQVPDKPLQEGAVSAAAGPLQGVALSDGYVKWQLAADAACSRDPNAVLDASGELSALRELLRELLGGSEEAALLVGRRLIKHLWEVPGKAHASLHVDCLALAADVLSGGAGAGGAPAPGSPPAGPGGRRLAAELTQLWVALASEAKFNRDIGERLLARGLLLLPEVDAYLARVLVAQRPASAIDFGVLLVRAVKDGLAGAADVAATLDVLGKLAGSVAGGEQLLQLLSAARAASRVRAAERAELPAIGGLRDKGGDPAGLHQQVAGLFEEFARRCVVAPDEKMHAAFVQQLRAAGLLNMDDATDRMLRVLVELAVAHCLASETPGVRPDGGPAPGPLSFLALDPLVKLAACLTLVHGGGEAFLGSLLRMVVALVRRDAEDRGPAFNARPYLRLLAGLASEMGNGAEAGEPGALRLVRLIGEALLLLAPSRVPGFAFAYLELLAHRAIMPRLLGAPAAAAGPLALGDLYEALLLGLLGFLEPALRAAELTDPLRALYKGTLRLLLVLLHDFPEFLCDHHFRLCDVIPPPAIQMRNLILSAFPRNMRLPDPFTPNLKFDKLPEIAAPPQGAPPRDLLLPPPLRAQVDALLARRAQPGALQALVARLVLPAQGSQQKQGQAQQQQQQQQQQPGGQGQSPVAGQAASAALGLGIVGASVAPPALGGAGGAVRYAGSLLHALVLYVGGCHAPGSGVERDDPGLSLLAGLAGELDAEGRYLLLNAIANQLRYPNSHTYYFSCVLLTLFADAPTGPAGEALQAQITRVLLERLIVNRPHPWGLLITFIELIKNERFNFWNHPFTKAAPELEKLFESVARSCMAAPPAIKPQDVAAAAAGGTPQAAGVVG
ncbi:CCR4-NOT transcription complex subunit 1 [Monoraphidium neglectum]|uniref:CCR4-NOT transcription complex subunit 1 n=1 Tax=Monoraphidium neglectum TaxID=145388 RepID=A0A0D2MP60_9CHLO|nr:CCR4-NOT transcription complex subunit 1 [Monoraphidium neglectum]KIY96495.1 CCR4-NOT transcription complex subunit 1 [Monoraphidium neglectum]|eukprot:XP_013895515.1 CCR4-NOT transcription complex subunit 1 [Monoraphidium neglectum]